MGDIADMMLEGLLCCMCGVYESYLKNDGIPDYCSGECAKNQKADWWFKAKKRGNSTKVRYEEYKKWVEKAGLKIAKKYINCGRYNYLTSK